MTFESKLSHIMLFRLFALSAIFCGQIHAQSLVPANWDPALAGDKPE
jgi:hypothetical protein